MTICLLFLELGAQRLFPIKGPNVPPKWGYQDSLGGLFTIGNLMKQIVLIHMVWGGLKKMENMVLCILLRG